MTSLEIIKDELAKIEKDEDHILAGRQGNMIKYLSKALSVAVERIEGFQQPCTRTDYTVGQLDNVVCEMANDALTTIANILSGGKDGNL